MKSVHLFLIFSILVGGTAFYLDKAGFNKRSYAQAPNDHIILIGQIFGIMESGNAYAIKGTNNSKFPQIAAFYPDEQSAKEILDGTVFIKGRIDNVDCESYRSIFKGCIPWVEIEDIWSIKK